MWLWITLALAGPGEEAQWFVDAAARGEREDALTYCAGSFRDRSSLSCADLVDALGPGGPLTQVRVGQVDAAGGVARIHLDLLADGVPFAVWLRAEQTEPGWRFTDGTDLEGDPESLVPELAYHRDLADALLERLVKDPVATCGAATREACVGMAQAVTQGGRLRGLTAWSRGRRAVVVVDLVRDGTRLDALYLSVKGRRVVGADDEGPRVR